MRSGRRGIIWSDALAVAEEGDVEAVAEAPAVAEALLEGGGDSAGHLGGSRSEGHEEDVGGGPAAEAGEDGENLVGVGGTGVDELELEVLAVGAGAVEEAKSRFQYDMGTLIKTLSFEYREDNIGMTQNVKFTGPSRISFSRLSGNGAFFLTERLKGFTTYLLSGSVAFTYGFGDQTNWDWKIEYETPKNSSAILEIFGHARIHEATEDATPRPTMELPSFVQVEDLGRTSGQGRLKLLVYDERGNRYQFKMYKRLGDDYSEFYYSPPVKGDANPAPLYMTYPIQTTFWLVGWVKNSQNLWQYIGEKEFYSQYDTK